MKQSKYLLNTLLAAALGIVLLVCIVYRTLVPAVILPKFTIPNTVLLSLALLVVEHFLTLQKKRQYLVVALLSALSFGLLPLAAGFITPAETPIYALGGGIVFTLTSWLYTLMLERMSDAPLSKITPIFAAIGLYLSAQCFSGILL